MSIEPKNHEKMEYWVFNKKEMNLIADLMVNELVKMPDNSYISMMELFQIALDAEYVDGHDKSGYRVNGYKISDITMPNGERISEAIKWNFEDGRLTMRSGKSPNF